MIIRTAEPHDAHGMHTVLKKLVLARKRTGPSDLEFVNQQYIEHPDRIDCFVAEDASGNIMGFQSLRLMAGGNDYGAPAGWGFIGTHISPDAARMGIGRRLFTATSSAAKSAGIPAIEAFIGVTNADGRAYYRAMGFETHRLAEGVVCKSYLIC